jgi:hypothetical protein
MTVDGGEKPITRDGLRAELSALELRLRDLFAPATRVDAVEARLLTKEKVAEMIGEALRVSEARGWTSRERLMGVGVFLIALATLLLSAYTVFK